MLTTQPPGTDKIRAIVTDDTALYRRTIADILRSIPDVEVVASAFDGDDCLELAKRHQPDFITLDMQMPRRDGLSTLDELKKLNLDCEVVMVCSETIESADQTLQALRKGALDLILKPGGKNLAENKRNLEDQLKQQIQTVRFRRSNAASTPTKVALPAATRVRAPSPVPIAAPLSFGRPKCVGIGVSTGGPQALSLLIQGLPRQLPIPIFIVQHMPPIFTKSLADHLNRIGTAPVSEAIDGETAVPGHVYIAPGGNQMRIEKKAKSFVIRITNDPPVSACRPSVDYLFHSIDECVGKDALAVILTGMGNDGLAGCKRLFANGARVLAQNEESCVVYGMPRQVVENNVATEILPLDQMAKRIAQIAQGVA
jgi:two-component system chemotaxis response regulator CheB